MAEVAVSRPDRVQIQLRNGGFPKDASCFICGENDVEALRLVERTLLNVVFGHALCFLQKIPNNRSVVSTSCHPENFYHYKCLKTWLDRSPTCPLDRGNVDPTEPSLPASNDDYKDPDIEVARATVDRVFGLSMSSLLDVNRFPPE